METLFQALKLSPNDVFLDIGHGIGNAPLQAAYTHNCPSRGIELCPQRHDQAILFKEHLLSFLPSKHNTDLRHGNFLHAPPDFLRADVTFVNNAKESFAARSGSSELEVRIGCLFADAPVGARLATLDPIRCLGRSRRNENKMREKEGLCSSPEASFFEHDKIQLEDAVTWSSHSIEAHVYERVDQGLDPEGDKGVFLCSQGDCKGSRVGMLAVSWKGRVGEFNKCLHCHRERRKMLRSAMPSGKSEEESKKQTQGAPEVIIDVDELEIQEGEILEKNERFKSDAALPSPKSSHDEDESWH